MLLCTWLKHIHVIEMRCNYFTIFGLVYSYLLFTKGFYFRDLVILSKEINFSENVYLGSLGYTS